MRKLPPGETGGDTNDTIKIRYVVVTAHGALVTSRNGPSHLYRNRLDAQRQARNDGDCVVMVHVDLSREPVFIRTKVQPTEE